MKADYMIHLLVIAVLQTVTVFTAIAQFVLETLSNPNHIKFLCMC